MGHGWITPSSGDVSLPAQNSSIPAAAAIRGGKGGRAALVCCALALALTATACAASTTGTAAAGTSAKRSDPGCDMAIKTISVDGPPVYRAYDGAKNAIEQATIRVAVGGLDVAADATDDPQAKQSIKQVANDFSRLLDNWNGDKATIVSRLLTDTSHLKSVCGD